MALNPVGAGRVSPTGCRFQQVRPCSSRCGCKLATRAPSRRGWRAESQACPGLGTKNAKWSMCTLIPFSLLKKKNSHAFIRILWNLWLLFPCTLTWDFAGNFSECSPHELQSDLPLRSSECIPGGTPDAMGPPCAVTWLSCGPAFTVMPDLIHLRRTSSGQVFAHHLSSPFNPETLVYQPYCSDPFVATLLSGSLSLVGL